MRQLVAVLLVLAAFGGLAAGCGESGPTDEEKREAQQRLERAEERKAKELAAVRAKECTQQLRGFTDALEELGSRLQVGLSYDEYFDELGSIQVAYDRLPINELHPRCLGRVGVPTEKAFQAYVAAGEAWEECIDALNCGDGISPAVQDDWSKAGRKVEQALTLGIVEVGAVLAADKKSAAQVVKAPPDP